MLVFTETCIVCCVKMTEIDMTGSEPGPVFRAVLMTRSLSGSAVSSLLSAGLV